MYDSLRPAAAAAALVIFHLSCAREGPIPQRSIAPRLTTPAHWRPCPGALRPGRVVEAAVCDEPPHNSHKDESIACDIMITDHAGALRALTSDAACTNAAVEYLEILAGSRRDARIASDLAAAYFVRAQRSDQPVDLLRALDTSDRAGALIEGHFNRALALEALRLEQEALDGWRDIERRDTSDWRSEAVQRRTKLVRKLDLRLATRWDRRRLAEIIRVGDTTAIRQIVSLYPGPAQRWLEEDILPQWARASSLQQREQGGRQLDMALLIAREIERATGDRYILDAVERIAGTPQTERARRKALEEGHQAFANARNYELTQPKEALPEYRKAREAFTRAGSPLRFGAQIDEAVRTFSGTADLAGALALLPSQRDAAAHPHLLMRIASNRAYLLYGTNPTEALALYDTALAYAHQTRDREQAANFHARKSSILLRIMGNKDDALRGALLAMRDEAAVTEVRWRLYIFGQMAETVLAHEYPAIALIYENEIIDYIQAELNAPGDVPEERVQSWRNNLATAFRVRAAIHLALGSPQRADEDLRAAIRLTEQQNESDPIIRNALLARIQEIAGQSAMQANDPGRAVDAFTAALDLRFPAEYSSFRAMLLAQRAKARRQLGNASGARTDLLTAIDALRKEEQALLELRKRGTYEKYLAGFFSRPRDVYENLIRQLVDGGDHAGAFQIAEKSRAFEPLNLALQADVVPETIRKWTRDGEALPLERVRAALPEGTYVVEYYLLSDRVYTWIVARNHFELLSQPIERSTVDHWSRTLERAAAEGDKLAAQATLQNAFDALAARPLAKIRRRIRPGERIKLVFVPDRSIHGLPLNALYDRAEQRYVVQRHPVSIAASATFYVFSLDRDKILSTDAPATALLIADPAFDTTLPAAQPLQPLPGAYEEVASIALLYDREIVLDTSRATVPAFLNLAPESTVVHFAGHAVANPEAPFRSLLLFAPAPGHDGILDAQQLLTHLRSGKTRLCVLAACRSAGGVAVGAEGLAPLVRPLIAAGIPAVVGTLWDIKDQSSQALFVAFHRYYRNGLDADEALQRAQIDLLNSDNETLSSPLVWGSAQVVGHASSPFKPRH